MSRFILDGFASAELVSHLHNDVAFSLVRELCHKFNLRVLTYVQQGDIRKFQLCLPNGMAVGKAWAKMESDAKYTYYYRTP